MSSLPITTTTTTTTTMASPNNNDDNNTTKSSVRLGSVEQFAIGIISGGLSAMGLSPLRWLVCVVILPSLLLEIYEYLQLSTYYNNKISLTELRHLKKLRQQYFGQGVISGSGVSGIISNLLTHQPAMALFHVLIYTILSLGWTVLWQLWPNLAALQRQQQQQQAVRLTPAQQKQLMMEHLV